MKILKFWAVSILAVVPVAGAAEQVAEVPYNPSPLGIYNQLKIKDTATFRPALRVHELQLGSTRTDDMAAPPQTVFNRVIIATQRDAQGNIRLSDVQISNFANNGLNASTNLSFPQAELKTQQINVHNGGTFNADAGYSRTEAAGTTRVYIPRNALGGADGILPVYADTVKWSHHSGAVEEGFSWAGNGGEVGTFVGGDYGTQNVAASGVMLDNVKIQTLPAGCTTPTFVPAKAVGGEERTFLLLRC